jgi:hypothetical protein
MKLLCWPPVPTPKSGLHPGDFQRPYIFILAKNTGKEIRIYWDLLEQFQLTEPTVIKGSTSSNFRIHHGLFTEELPHQKSGQISGQITIIVG